MFMILFPVSLSAADTLKIAPCDEAFTGIFNDLICLSRDKSVLRRYEKGILTAVYSGDESSSKPILADPLRPVPDGADNIFILDIGTNCVIGWDRFLNIHSITCLDDEIWSPGAFTVTSEHDWLIYDEFFGQIMQIHSGEDLYTLWGNRSVSGEIDLISFKRQVLIYLKDRQILRICNEEGKTLSEWSLPNELTINRIFPLNQKGFALCTESGVYIWKPEQASLRYLSDLSDVVFCGISGKSYILVDQKGVVVTIP